MSSTTLRGLCAMVCLTIVACYSSSVSMTRLFKSRPLDAIRRQRSICKFSMSDAHSSVHRSEGMLRRRDAAQLMACASAGVIFSTFSKPAFARPDGDGLFDKVSAQATALDSVEAFIDAEKWTEARKKAKEIDTSLRSGVIMPLSRSVGRKVKGVVEMQTTFFDDFVELEKCNRAKDKVCAKEQVNRVRITVNKLLGLEEEVMKFL